MLTKVIRIDSQIKKAFFKVKQDIDELREMHRGSVQVFRTRQKEIETQQESHIKKKIDDIQKQIDVLKDESTELKSAQDKNGEDHVFEIEKVRHMIEGFSDRIQDMNHKLKKLEQVMTLQESKLQEFENISVDIEDVEKNFITREEIEKSIKESHESNKMIKKISKRMDTADSKVAKMSEEIHTLAQKASIESLQEQMIDIKDSSISRKDLEQMNDRIDSMEDRFIKRMDSLETDNEQLENHIKDVLMLKKQFITKEQYKDLRKEIKLLVKGLKDVQKIKEKIKKL